jgi:hypothetical protein
MSWTDRIANTIFSITTGDGKFFTPLWKNGETSKEFNVSVFEYINVPGARVDRKQVGPQAYPLLFWFSGENNLEQSAVFSQSANDPRTWTVRHPMYGDIVGQPLSIKFNDSGWNVTEISVEFLESNTDVALKATISLPDEVESQFDGIVTASPEEYAAKTDLKPADVVTVRSLADKVNAEVNKLLDASNYGEYQLAMNKAFTQINNLILAPVGAIQALQGVIGLPATFALSVVVRINLLQTIFNSFLDVVTLKPTHNNKALFEAGGAGVLSALSIAMANPQPGDYNTRRQVAAASAALTELYAQYLQVLNDAYVPAGNTASFTAGYQTQLLLQTNIITTVAGLTALAFDAKQERIITLGKDSNLIILTHRYMGLDAVDANLQQFRTINNIKNKSLFLVPKGKEIRYYV